MRVLYFSSKQTEVEYGLIRKALYIQIETTRKAWLAQFRVSLFTSAKTEFSVQISQL